MQDLIIEVYYGKLKYFKMEQNKRIRNTIYIYKIYCKKFI